MPTRNIPMKLTRIVVAAAVAMTAGLTLAAARQDKNLRLASTVWTPFTDVAGKPRFALDLVEAALDRIGVPSATSFVENAQFTSADHDRTIRRERRRMA